MAVESVEGFHVVTNLVIKLWGGGRERDYAEVKFLL